MSGGPSCRRLAGPDRIYGRLTRCPISPAMYGRVVVSGRITGELVAVEPRCYTSSKWYPLPASLSNGHYQRAITDQSEEAAVARAARTGSSVRLDCISRAANGLTGSLQTVS
ncbi:hypothetical protein Bbelb_151850 [Branchiostoma belcheri]|nr:hypothetical protein Bbelb_151850 [Branchiostoma belcheri]